MDPFTSSRALSHHGDDAAARGQVVTTLWQPERGARRRCARHARFRGDGREGAGAPQPGSGPSWLPCRRHRASRSCRRFQRCGKRPRAVVALPVGIAPHTAVRITARHCERANRTRLLGDFRAGPGSPTGAAPSCAAVGVRSAGKPPPHLKSDNRRRPRGQEYREITTRVALGLCPLPTP